MSFILSLFVFLIHFRVFSVFKHAEGFLQYALDSLLILTKVAVPLFFVISGALFYRDYEWSMTFKKWKNRFFSLCIPYLVWNTLWLILALLGEYTPLGSLLGGVKASLSLQNILNGVFLYEYFEPFWFIFQLIILTAFCPIIYLLLRNKWIGLICVVSFFLASCFGFELNPVLFPSSNMVLFYLIGAWIGIHQIAFFTTRKNKLYATIGFATYILCCVFHGTKAWHPDWFASAQVPLLVNVISCGSFWIAFDYFDIRKCPKYMSRSFLIYALHSFLGAAISKILAIVLPSGQGYLILNAVLTLLITVMVICGFGFILDKYFPILKRVLTGR